MKQPAWEHANDPVEMLGFARKRLDRRKQRLLCCEVVRLVWHLLPEGPARAVVEVAQRFADGHASENDLAVATAGARDEAARLWRGGEVTGWAAVECAVLCAGPQLLNARQDRVEGALRGVVEGVPWTSAHEGPGQEVAHHRDVCELIRDLADPFGTWQAEPAWLAWNSGVVAHLARSIYEERRLGDLPVLADALEEAGCTDSRWLQHLRARRRHGLGCVALDALRA